MNSKQLIFRIIYLVVIITLLSTIVLGSPHFLIRIAVLITTILSSILLGVVVRELILIKSKTNNKI